MNGESNYIAKLRAYFEVGRVVYLPYWMSYDKVISFDAFPSKLGYTDWSVTVAACDKEGNIIGEERTHCTVPKELGGI